MTSQGNKVRLWPTGHRSKLCASRLLSAVCNLESEVSQFGNPERQQPLDELGSLQKVQTTNGRPATIYSLDMVISVGYRVSSAQVTMIIRQSNSAEVHNCAHFESRQMAMAYGIIPPQRTAVAP